MNKVALVIPAYRVSDALPRIIGSIPNTVNRIFVVDDGCPDSSGKILQEQCQDSRLEVLFHEENQGVGKAVVTGYKAALRWGAHIIVRIDGDGQMDTSQINRFIEVLAQEKADFVKGNRFFNLRGLKGMPSCRLIGNTILSFAAKAMSGYWNIMDPTNGFTAIDVRALRQLPLDQLEPRYFFESDFLYQLSLLRARVVEVAMVSRYGPERSNLSLRHSLLTFPSKYVVRLLKRIFYNYYLRDFNAFSIQLILGGCLLLFGCIFGGIHWYANHTAGVQTPTGTILLAALPVILGFQALLAAISFDVLNVPQRPISEDFDRDERRDLLS